MTVCLTMLNKCHKCVLNQNKYNFLSSSQRIFSVVLLDDTSLDIPIETKCTVGDLFQKVCDKLQLKEFDIFGLAQKIKNEYHFLSHDEKISKLINTAQKHNKNLLNVNMNTNILYSQSSASRQPTSRFIFNKFTNNQSDVSNCSSQQQPPPCDVVSYSSISISNKAYTQSSLSEMSSCSCSSMEPAINVYFVVKYYVTDPLVLRDSKTRYLYYLQLRRNYLDINHKMSDERYFVIASLALLVDFGPFDPKTHVGKYFDPNLYFPKWMITKLGDKFIYENMPRLHEQQSRQTVANSQNKFCMEMSTDDEFPFNFHLYGVYKNKEETPGTICLGISPRGILVFELRSHTEICLISTFQWSSVAKLNADKKKFEILINCDSTVRKYTYYTSSEKFSKYLLELSKSTHTFTSNIFARLANHKTLANYVSESYSEKVLAYNENRLEPYEEREIRAKSLEKLKEESVEVEKSPTSELSSSSIHVKLDQQPGLEKKTDMDKSSSLSSLSMSSYETPIGVDYSKIVNGFNLDGLNLTAASIGGDNRDRNSCSSQSRNYNHRSEPCQSFIRTESLSDYYEYNKKILDESSVATEYQIFTETTHKSEHKYLISSKIGGTSSLSSSSSSSSSYKSKSHETGYPIIQFNSLPNMELNRSSGSELSAPVVNSAASLTPSKLTPNYVQYFPGYVDKDEGYFNEMMSIIRSRNNHSNVEYLNDEGSCSSGDGDVCEGVERSPDSGKSGHSGESDYINSSYVSRYKYKKPPSYEESVRKMMKSSASSSLSSSFNDDVESIRSKTIVKIRHPVETNQVSSDEKEIIYENVDTSDDKSVRYNDFDIRLSLENLEEIRATAASMSLPLLTALCSDQSLIKSLEKSKKNQASF